MILDRHPQNVWDGYSMHVVPEERMDHPLVVSFRRHRDNRCGGRACRSRPIAPGSVVVGVGANIGVFAILADAMREIINRGLAELGFPVGQSAGV